MLLLGSRTITVDGITVYGDHADPEQFWYLPGPVSVARRLPDKRAIFDFIKYRPAAVSGGAKGGGFLVLQTALRLDPSVERRIVSKLAAICRGRPRLSAVNFDEGEVRCLALNIAGTGDTAAQPAGPGSFNAVEKILGSTSPSLAGDNEAAFSLTLSQEGATIVEAALRGGRNAVGVIYELKYTAMRPALHVKITADLARCYEQFSADVNAQIYYVNAGIEAGFEKLVQDGAIKIEVIDFSGADDQKEKEKWALDFFKDKLLTEWFTPTLSPGKLAGGGAHAESLDAVIKRGDAMRPPASKAPPKPTADNPTKPKEPANKTPRPTAVEDEPNAKDTATDLPKPKEGAEPNKPTSPTDGSGEEVSSVVAPREATGVKYQAPKDSKLAALGDQGGGGAPTQMAVSFKLKYVKQEERKTVTLEYNRQEAIQKTYNPPGFISFLAADLAQDHFLEVDLDSPFFRVFTVSAETKFDFDRIGLTSAQVSLDYGEGPGRKHADFTFEKPDLLAAQKWEVFMASPSATSYEQQVQFHFSPDSDWEGEKYSYELPRSSTEDRTLLLNPYDHLGFLDVQVVPDKIDWQVMDSITVELRYEDSAGWTAKRDVLLTSGTPTQHWKLRLSKRNELAYSYRIVHRLKDGSEKIEGPFTTQATKLPVSDPLPGELAIEFVPMWPKGTQRVFIDVKYADPANNYERQERLQVPGTAIDPVSLRIALYDPKLRRFSYRYTFFREGGQIDQRQPIETDETLLGIV